MDQAKRVVGSSAPSVCSNSPKLTDQATLSPPADTASSRGSPCSGRAGGYPGRSFGGSPVSQQDVSPAGASSSTLTPASPRSVRKPVVTSFTDPMNPFGRPCSKQVSSAMMQEVRNDSSRAGARTRNAGICQMEYFPASPKETRERLIPHRYGGQDSKDWRPGRAAPTCAVSGQRSPRGTNSEGVGDALGSAGGFDGWSPSAAPGQAKGRASLGNYLNDMKRAGRARRQGPAEPSDFLRRMNDTLHKLPAEMREDRPQRSASCDHFMKTPRRYVNAESDGEDAPATVYGFTRKRSVGGRSARLSHPGFLAHEEPAQPLTPRSPRADVQHKADQRFEEVIKHMKASSSLQKETFQRFKDKSENTDGLLFNEQVVKYAV